GETPWPEHTDDKAPPPGPEAQLVDDLAVVQRFADAYRKRSGQREVRGSAPVDSSTSLPDPFPDEFRLVKLLGEGAFGWVWLAEDLKLRRQVALKTLKGIIGRQRLELLEREANLLGQFSHPNIVRVHAWRESDAGPYLVLQYVSGGSFEERVRRDGPLSWDLAARYVADVGEGLVAVHKR